MPGLTIDSQWRVLFAKETLAGLGLGLLLPFGIPKPKKAQALASRRHQSTIILIHGFMANRSCFLPLQTYLKFHGVKNIVCFEYGLSDTVESAAIKLKFFIKQNIRGGHLKIVGHSKGGLVAQAYLQMLGGARKTKTCISIGSPLRGTYNAYWLPSRIGQELRPGSSLLRRLEDTAAMMGSVSFCSIAGKADNIVLPRCSADRLDSNYVEATGHLGLLWSPQVMNTVLQVLGA